MQGLQDVKTAYHSYNSPIFVYNRNGVDAMMVTEGPDRLPIRGNLGQRQGIAVHDILHTQCGQRFKF